VQKQSLSAQLIRYANELNPNMVSEVLYLIYRGITTCITLATV